MVNIFVRVHLAKFLVFIERSFLFDVMC